jgi:hypothetical protein
MSFEAAIDILELSNTNKYVCTNARTINMCYVKKQYHRMALIYHPDKNNDSIESNKTFKSINEAYEVIKQHYNNNHTFSQSDYDDYPDYNKPSNLYNYNEIVKNFITSLFISTMNEGMAKIIYDIVCNIKTTALQNINELSPEKLLTVYSFLYKHKQILNIHDEMLQTIKLIINNRCTTNEDKQLLVLYPTIIDLIESNIYKLSLNGSIYLIPLWHSSLAYDIHHDPDDDSINVKKQGNELHVMCIPKLHDNIDIDENNNITYHMSYKLNNTIIQQRENIEIYIGNKKFTINFDEIKLKSIQLFVFKNQGMPIVNQTDSYDTLVKGDVIIRFSLLID